MVPLVRVRHAGYYEDFRTIKFISYRLTVLLQRALVSDYSFNKQPSMDGIADTLISKLRFYKVTNFREIEMLSVMPVLGT